MKIVIASGKGGTGKTTVATNLTFSIEGGVELLDCDVEEPNCHIFLKPEFSDTPQKESVFIKIPEVDNTQCTACGECGKFCEFNAIISLKTKALVFPELCHGCGGCAKVCPAGAISEANHEIGIIEISELLGRRFIKGCLNVREIMSPHLIHEVKKKAQRQITIIDSPPGTTCPMVAAVRGNDFVVLVTEPTPFGFHDLKLAVETVRKLGVPFGVVINRSGENDFLIQNYCDAEKIPILLEIGDDRRIAEAYSRGELLVNVFPDLKEKFQRLYSRIQENLSIAGERK